MTFTERLNYAMKLKGFSQDKLAKKANMAQSSVWKLTSGTAKSTRKIIEIANALKVDPEWLAKGVGEMDIKSDVIPLGDISITKVPIINYVQAGNWTGVHPDNDFEYILTTDHLSNDSFALRIKGNSMNPDFKENDLIIIDPQVKPNAGDFVVAMNGDHEATFKKYQFDGYDNNGREHFILVALNSDYQYKMSSREQDIRIVGTLVEHRIYRKKR